MANGVKVYGDLHQAGQLAGVIDEYQDLFVDRGDTVDIPEDQWMPIALKPDISSTPARVYPLGQKHRDVIDETFDKMQAQGKLTWSDQPTPFSYPCFVVWRDTPTGRKGRVVIDIRELNKITLNDTYPLPLQADVIALIQSYRHITVVDAVGWFHQFMVQVKERHKLTIVSHRRQEQSSVALVGYNLTTHIQTPSHTGTDWFSDVNASSKILRYLSSGALDLNKETTSFLDLGTGNGEMLFQLRSEGEFEGRMVGVDYSPALIQLCQERLRALQSEGYCIEDIAFEVWDVLKDAPLGEWRGGFDVLLDKGTFDAVSLSEEGSEGYKERVEPLVREGGWLFVTSCNWTEEELGVWFEGGALARTGRVEYPVFRFRGELGQSVATVCFRKKG